MDEYKFTAEEAKLKQQLYIIDTYKNLYSNALSVNATQDPKTFNLARIKGDWIELIKELPE